MAADNKKKQAVFIRIPGINAYSEPMKFEIAQTIQKALQSHYPDKEVVVMIFNDDIHFCSEGDIRDMIDTMENLIK